MSNINDYLLWRGDLSLKSSPFNEIDDMILARFSYMPFHKIKMDSIETVESIAKKLAKFKDEEFSYHGDKDLITRMGKSIRFKNMHVTDFKANTDKEAEKQFAAVTVHIDDDNMYISFNGTDDSIIGWKEDFNLSFMENIPSQIEGAKYLKEQSERNDKKIRIGGHSKGGNIAIYSATGVSKETQDRIISVTNYDGPGFDKQIVESASYNRILDKIFTFIPQNSIIGRILEHRETVTLVKSTEKGIYQHDIFSWQVLGTKVVVIDKLTNNSEFFNKTISTWLKETNSEQRKIFIDGVFEMFDSTKASTFKELTESKVKNIDTLLKTYNNIDEDEKRIIHKMILEFANSARKSMFEVMKNKE